MPENATRADGRIVTFYSYKGGVGRTMALANVAWLLASAGRRVLVVDWDLESPGLSKYLHPFLDQDVLAATPGIIDLINDYAWAVTSRQSPREPGWHRAYAQIMRYAVPLEWPWFAGGGELSFVSQGRQNRDYSSLISSMDWDNFYERLGGGQFLDALRADMKKNYDYILIDSRTGLTDIADICTVQLPDVLVDCFTLSTQSIDGAAAVAKYIDKQYSSRNIRILPVPMRIENAENEKMEAGRALARTQFSGLPQGLDRDKANKYWLGVEVPHRAFYAFEEILAVFGDVPESHGTLLAAYDRLARAIADDDELPEFTPIEEELRLATLRRFTRQRPGPANEVVVSYVSADRAWADWTRLVLERSGLHVLTHCADSQPADEIVGLFGSAEEGTAAKAVVLLSSSYVASPSSALVWDVLMDTTQIPHVYQDPITVRLPRTRLEGRYADVDPLDFSESSEDQATGLLLGALDRTVRSGERPDDGEAALAGPRFPGLTGKPEIWNVRSRVPYLTERSELIEKLRDRFVSGANSGLPQVLFGRDGAGKTQLAVEYAYRFRADYDVIWWISAEQTSQISGSLAELAPQLGVEMRADVADTATRACNVLRRGIPYSRWLLVYDGAVDPHHLEGYLPSGTGHVLITSHHGAWSEVATPLEVTVFSPEQSDANLMGQVPGLSAVDARRIGLKLDFVPLYETQAAAWLRATGLPADLYLSRLDGQRPPADREVIRSVVAPATRGDSRAPDSSTATALAFELLGESSEAAARLLQLCAFCAPDPDSISLDLIYRDEMARLLVRFDPTLREKFALASVDQEDNCIQVYPEVQQLIRSRMTTEERDQACRDVHSVLVGVLPSSGTEDPRYWDRYERILPHITPSRAADSTDGATMQLLIELVRYQWKRNRFDEAEELALELSEKWARNIGEDHWQRLYLLSQLANVLRSKGRYSEALEMDTDVYRRQQRIIGEDHTHTWITAGGIAADLRALGNFREALEWDRKIYRTLSALLADQHPRTLSAANNLAVSHRLMGQYGEAREIDEATLRARTLVLGPDQPDTLLSQAYLAQDMREEGEFVASVELLRDALDRYHKAVGPRTIDALRIAKSLAVSMRRAGLRREAYDMADETYGFYLQEFPNTPDARAAALERASCLSAVGNKQNAYELAQEVLNKQTDAFGRDHPYTLAAATNVASYLLGSKKKRDALKLGQDTLRKLQDSLGEKHPFVLNCSVNVANALADLHRYDEAAQLERSTLQLLEISLGESHPDTLICRANLSLTLFEIARNDKELRGRADAMREETIRDLRRALGEEHPALAELKAGKRLSRDLEWQPI